MASSPESSSVTSGARVRKYPMKISSVVTAIVIQSTRRNSGGNGVCGAAEATGLKVAEMPGDFEFGEFMRKV